MASKDGKSLEIRKENIYGFGTYKVSKENVYIARVLSCPFNDGEHVTLLFISYRKYHHIGIN